MTNFLSNGPLIKHSTIDLTIFAWLSLDACSELQPFTAVNIANLLSINDCDKFSKKYSCTLIFPEDVVVGKKMDGGSIIKELNEVDNDDIILDIGPKTIKRINKTIELSKTILWNGPAGYFENPNFAKGSFEIGKKIADKYKSQEIFSVVGGGDTVALINHIGIIDSFNFVSTAGGAFLEYLEGKELPGINALN